MLRSTLLATLVALGVFACSSTESSSGGSSGGSSSGSPGTSSTSTSSGSTTQTCKKASLCVGGACKCIDGPNKDQPCKDPGAGSDACETLCKVCESSSSSSSSTSGGTSGTSGTSGSSSDGFPQD